MNRFRGMEEYNNLITDIKKNYMPVSTNCFMYFSQIEKYILQDRLLYEKYMGGLLIYIDEITYYRLYYYWNTSYPFFFEKKDKAVVIIDIYNVEKSSEQIKMEEKFSNSGFRLDKRTRYIGADYQLIQENLKKYLPLSERLFSGAKLEVKHPTKGMIPQIRELQASMETIHFYEIPYMSDEEMYEAGCKGRIICIVNPDGKVCAVSTFLYDNSVHGWLGILKDYRNRYGIIPILVKHKLSYAQQNNLKMTGAISENNKKSIKAHFELGYCWLDKYNEFWVIDSK